MQGQTIDDIPSAIIEDASQLVKANSIAGNKMNNIDVVYTMWDNLKKTASMDVGQVSFHRDKGKVVCRTCRCGNRNSANRFFFFNSSHLDVRKVRVDKRINEIVNRLNKTKVEEHPGT